MPRKIASKAERLKRIEAGMKADEARTLKRGSRYRDSAFAGTRTEKIGVRAKAGEKLEKDFFEGLSSRRKKKVAPKPKPKSKGKKIETRQDRRSQEDVLGPAYTVSKRRKKK